MVRRYLFVAVLFALCGAAQEPAPKQADPWQAVRTLEGSWQGIAEGQAGRGTVERRYEFVMRGKYLHERNVSTYPPQEKNPKGEVHEHWTMFSFDRARRRLVMRQFHVEGFVNQYSAPVEKKEGEPLLFESESFENLPAGWKACERYEFHSTDEFVETFELAAPGKEFEVYSRARFKRVKP
jgi:hypothetical protein